MFQPVVPLPYSVSKPNKVIGSPGETLVESYFGLALRPDEEELDTV